MKKISTWNDLVSKYGDIEIELIKNIIKEIENNPYKKNWYQDFIKKKYGIDKKQLDIIQEFFKDYDIDLSNDDEIYKYYSQAKTLGLISFIPVDKNAYNLLFEKTMNELNKKIVAQTTKEVFEIVKRVELEVNLKIVPYDVSLRNAYKELGKKGITCVTYERKDGSEVNYSIEPYVRREMMTSVAQFNKERSLKILEDMDAEEVITSQHIGARNKGIGYRNHESWQGKVFHRSEFEEKTGLGEVDGLCGINCRHTFFAYLGQKLMPPIEDKGEYDLTQKQRYLERQVRKSKREFASATTDEEKMIARKKISKAQKNVRDFIKEHHFLKRDYLREKIVI